MLEHSSRGQYRKHVICIHATRKWLSSFLDLIFLDFSLNNYGSLGSSLDSLSSLSPKLKFTSCVLFYFVYNYFFQHLNHVNPNPTD